MKLPGCRHDHPEAEILSAAGKIQATRRKTSGLSSWWATLTPQQKQEHQQKAAEKRWAKRTPN